MTMGGVWPIHLAQIRRGTLGDSPCRNLRTVALPKSSFAGAGARCHRMTLRVILKVIQLFPEKVQEAADNYSPALIANYTYDLVKEFNSFYQQVSILGEVDEAKRNFRIQLSKKVGEVIRDAFKLLGVDVPERM